MGTLFAETGWGQLTLLTHLGCHRLNLLTFVLVNCRYYKVNEVQKFTYKRRKDTNTSDVTVMNCAVEYFHVSQT